MSGPRVIVGLPTYNRAERFRRAVESVLAQDWLDLELLISDNASTDETAKVAEEYARADPRVRNVRQPHNLGPLGNFRFLFGEADAEYVMLLGDDDWLGPRYVSTCVELLDRRPDHAIVGGTSEYREPDGSSTYGRQAVLTSDSPADRVRTFYRHVSDNSLFYGVMRRSAVGRIPPLRDVIGADRLFVAALVGVGKATTLREISIHRDAGGVSRSYDAIVSLSGLPRRQRLFPQAWIAGHASAEILSGAGGFETLARAQRLVLSLRCTTTICARGGYSLARRAVARITGREPPELGARHRARLEARARAQG